MDYVVHHCHEVRLLEEGVRDILDQTTGRMFFVTVACNLAALVLDCGRWRQVLVAFVTRLDKGSVDLGRRRDRAMIPDATVPAQDRRPA